MISNFAHWKRQLYHTKPDADIESLNYFLLDIYSHEQSIVQRVCSHPNLSHLKQKLREHVGSNPNRNPFLLLVLSMHQKLRLTPHIATLMKFLTQLNSVINHKITREDCSEKQMQVFLNKNQNKSKNHQLRKEYDEFIQAWEEILINRTLFEVYFETDDILINFNAMMKVSSFVCESQEHVILRVLSILINWQNAFLDTSAICALQKNNSSSFLKEGEIVRIPMVSQLQVTSKQLVKFVWDEALLIYGQSNSEDACGNDILYDFDSIESSFAK